MIASLLMERLRKYSQNNIPGAPAKPTTPPAPGKEWVLEVSQDEAGQTKYVWVQKDIKRK